MSTAAVLEELGVLKRRNLGIAKALMSDTW